MGASPSHPEILLIENNVKICHEIRTDHVLRVLVDAAFIAGVGCAATGYREGTAQSARSGDVWE